MFSVVITSCRDEEGLYLTYYSLRQQLPNLDLLPEIIIVADGGSETKWEQLPNTRCLRVNTGSPQGSRDAGIKAAHHSSVVVIEAHVVVSNVSQLVKQHEHLNSTLTFCPRTGEGTELFDVYDCETDWDGTLWYKRLIYKQRDPEPYPVSQFGHSCFVVDRPWYLKSGGYTDLLKGWGGEEQLLCLKAWLLNGTCWMIPSIWQAHYLTRGAHAGRTSSDEYQQNLKIVRRTLEQIGDLKQLQGYLASIGVK